MHDKDIEKIIKKNEEICIQLMMIEDEGRRPKTKGQLEKALTNDMMKRMIKEKEKNPNLDAKKFTYSYIGKLIGIWVALQIIIILVFWR